MLEAYAMVSSNDDWASFIYGPNQSSWDPTNKRVQIKPSNDSSTQINTSYNIFLHPIEKMKNLAFH